MSQPVAKPAAAPAAIVSWDKDRNTGTATCDYCGNKIKHLANYYHGVTKDGQKLKSACSINCIDAMKRKANG